MVLRCAIVGLTGIGTRHALGMVGDERVILVAGCDDGYAQNNALSANGEAQATASEVGAAFKANYAQDYPGLRIYANHKEMLEKESPLDIVTVGISDHRHAEVVVDAANAGVKGIFCEKPLATTMEDTDRMLEACERNNVVLSVDHTRRFLPIWYHPALSCPSRPVPAHTRVSVPPARRAGAFTCTSPMVGATARSRWLTRVQSARSSTLSRGYTAPAP